jgi:arylsulfatase A-like enzyme
MKHQKTQEPWPFITMGTVWRLPGFALLLGLVAWLAVTPRDLPANDRPNFVIIFVDDLGYGDLGCFGSKLIQTPNIDRMAAEGMKFTDFYAQPICGPSRAAIMTGCYPMRVAERGNTKNTHPILHSREMTLAEVLREQGYATGCFGKWDLARHSQRNFAPDLMPNHQGFGYFFGTPTSNDAMVDLYRNQKRIEARADMNTLTQRYTDEVLEFMGRSKSRPFLVYLPHTMPHTELGASSAFRGKSKRGLYGDVVQEIDAGVGRILRFLQQEQLAANTYVLFTSDNGPWLIKNQGKVDGFRRGDHGGSAGPLRSGKVSTWEGRRPRADDILVSRPDRTGHRLRPLGVNS